MAYLRKWRKLQAQVRQLAENSDEHDEAMDIALAKSSDSEVEQIKDVQQNCVTFKTDDHKSDHSADCGSIADADIERVESSSFSDADQLANDRYLIYDSSDSDGDLSSSSEDETEPKFMESLASWVVKYNLPREGTNELLDILRQQGHRVPADSRTLLQTPQECKSEEKCGGHYVYFGLKSGILKILAQHPSYFCHASSTNNIRLEVNIDGVPIFKSSSHQMWPILCAFDRFRPFIVALFSGNAKPNSVDEYLKDFLDEILELQQNPIIYKDKAFHISIKVFICDAPARAFIKCTKGHTGYFSCERCLIKGTWNGRVVFNTAENHPLRTDEQFSLQAYDAHQVAKSPLIDVGISCISGFSLDYLHLVCLGVTKRLLIFLKSGPKECKLSYRHMEQISKGLEALAGKMPSDFARQPRTLFEIDRWKATEFRQFLLYTGAIVLKKVLPENTYTHFLSLMIGVSILLLSDYRKRTHYLPYARRMLTYFTENCTKIYGDTFTVYNVHNLLHLADDVDKFQCSLNDISAFKFENHLQGIKKMVKSAHNPLIQVMKRIAEFEKSKAHRSFKTLHTSVSTRLKDSSFLLKYESYAFVKEKNHNGTFVCDVIKQEHTQSFFVKPCDSKLLNIVYVKNLKDKASRKLLTRDDFIQKVVTLPCNEGYALFPMLHGVES